MRVNLTAQVLGHSVATGISFLVTAKELPEDAMETAKFTKNFDPSSKHLTVKNLKVHKDMEMHLETQVPTMHSLKTA